MTFNLYTEISGTEFNKIMDGKPLFKVLNGDGRRRGLIGMHHGFDYRIGLNIDTTPFKPTGNCSAGGLYFCSKENILKFYGSYGENIWRITVPNDARVYVEKCSFKANMIILCEQISIYNIFDMSTNECLMNVIGHSPFAIQYIKNQTDEICKLAVQKDGKLLQYVKQQTEEICEISVKQ
jgi:hypothetical protein